MYLFSKLAIYYSSINFSDKIPYKSLYAYPLLSYAYFKIFSKSIHFVWNVFTLFNKSCSLTICKFISFKTYSNFISNFNFYFSRSSINDYLSFNICSLTLSIFILITNKSLVVYSSLNLMNSCSNSEYYFLYDSLKDSSSFLFYSLILLRFISVIFIYSLSWFFKTSIYRLNESISLFFFWIIY